MARAAQKAAIGQYHLTDQEVGYCLAQEDNGWGPVQIARALNARRVEKWRELYKVRKDVAKPKGPSHQAISKIHHQPADPTPEGFPNTGAFKDH